MRIIKIFISFTILFTILLSTNFISNKFGFSDRIIQTTNAQVCGDGIVSGDEKCDTSNDAGCGGTDPICNDCVTCTCSDSKLVFSGNLLGLRTPVICIIKNLILFLLSIIGGIALLMLVFSGILYVFAGANPEAQTKAKKTFNYAIIGLIFVLVSYALIKIIIDLSI